MVICVLVNSRCDGGNVRKSKGVMEVGKAVAVEKERVQKLWKALAKYGIQSEEELNAELKKLKPLNIGVMVSPINDGDIKRGVN